MDLVTLAAAKSYINKRIDEGEIVTGATPQQAAQIEQNKINIAGLQTEIENKQPKGNYVKTVNGNKPDASGNVVVTTGGNSEAGFSPIATVKQTNSGAVISITDKNGTTTATIVNGIDGKDGADGADGGHYTPIVTQPTSDTMRISFTPSESDMPAVNPVTVNLPISEDSGENVDLTGYAKETWVREGFQPKGNYLTKVPDGYAKTEDIPTEPEDIGAQPKGSYASPDDIPKVPNWAMQTSKPSYTASEVGADPKGTAASAVSAHNTNNAAHNDIRLLIEGLTTRLNALANSTDTDLDQMAELVAYIKSNKSLIDGITTSKVSVADIVNNLTTNVANKPLSAAQGVAIKALIDGLSASLANYQPKGDYALASAVPTKVSQLQNDSKYLTAVTAAMITAALGYIPINPGLATLARHEDGLLYLFVDGKPVGSGVELPAGGIDGYVDADKNIVVRGLDEGVTYKFFFELEDGSLVEGGELVYDNTVYYTVTKNLTNCTISNSATQAIGGQSYSATITAKSGYELKSVTVTMGDSAVTVSGGKINITNVTGNIVITAVAEEIKASYTNLADPTSADWAVGKRFDGSGNLKDVDAGVNGATTNYIGGGFAVGDIIRVKGMDLSGSAYRCVVYDKNKALQSLAVLSGQDSYFSDIVVTSTSASFKIKSNMPSDGYIRFSGVLNGTSADVVITKNEEIA